MEYAPAPITVNLALGGLQKKFYHRARGNYYVNLRYFSRIACVI